MADDALLLDFTLDALAHLVGGADNRKNARWPKAKIDAFDGFDILSDKIAPEDEVLLIGSPNDAPVWPMDARWAAPFDATRDHGEGAGDGWIFKRVATLRPAEWRGKLRRVFPRMYERHESYINREGATWGSVVPYGVVGSSLVDAWAYNSPKSERLMPGQILGAQTPIPDVEKFDIAIAHGIELRREYLWSVLLGEEGLPRARFVTDALGVREAFRLRDIPPGRERRAALKHWVRQHWRQQRADPAAKSWVRAHMRGATDFAWNGLSCRVEPSREDVRRNMALPKSSNA